MDSGAAARGTAAHNLTITGLGPGNLAALPRSHRRLLTDPANYLLVRTIHHPAAAELAVNRQVESCDDIYERSETFDDVYRAVADRVLERSGAGPTIYAVPGSPLVGEFAVGILLERAPEAEVVPAESFVDSILRRLGYDPFRRGLRIVNGHELPDPWPLDAPTIVGHLDAPAVLADVTAALSRVLPEGSQVTVCANLGSDDEHVASYPVDAVPAHLAGLRTSLFVDTTPAGLFGLVAVTRRLRAECPWDRRQTHSSLVSHLVEEAHELIEAISHLPDGEPDYVAYGGLEEELGDVLLQVLLHAAIAAEKGAFGVDDVATRLQEKLVRRHPHVFGDVAVANADEVASNWERIKTEEKGGDASDSLLDGVTAGLPALERAMQLQRRAARVGFDWEAPGELVAVLRAEADELRDALATGGDVAHELGDILFTTVNLLRHLDLDPEVTLRRANGRFERRFRAMEARGALDGLSADELESRWQAAKQEVG